VAISGDYLQAEIINGGSINVFVIYATPFIGIAATSRIAEEAVRDSRSFLGLHRLHSREQAQTSCSFSAQGEANPNRCRFIWPLTE
jgi:hypothetical protein